MANFVVYPNHKYRVKMQDFEFIAFFRNRTEWILNFSADVTGFPIKIAAIDVISTEEIHPCCKFCGRLDEGNAGDYYHYHDCWRKNVWERLQIAIEQNGSPEEIAKLEHELEIASYVGD